MIVIYRIGSLENTFSVSMCLGIVIYRIGSLEIV